MLIYVVNIIGAILVICIFYMIYVAARDSIHGDKKVK